MVLSPTKHSRETKKAAAAFAHKRHARIGLIAALCEGALRAPHSYSGTTKTSVFERKYT